MEARTLAEVRAADAELLYSLFFPDGGRVAAAAGVGCVCLDYLTCSECERILGQSFLSIELAVRKKQRTDPPVPVARVDAGPEQGHGLEGSDAVAISGRAGQLGPGSHPPSDGVEGSVAEISGTADRLGTGSHPLSNGVEGCDVVAISGTADRLGPGWHSPSDEAQGFEAAISGMAARLGLAAAVGERAKEVFRKMEEASAWPQKRGPGRSRTKTRFQSKRPLAYAACLSIACRADGSALSLKELARAVAEDGSAAGRKDIAALVAHIRGRLGKEDAGRATGTVSVSSYVRRFGALVGLREADLAVALKAARRLEDGVLDDVRHSPDTVAAAVVCTALERAGAIRPGAKDVAAATGVSKQTIYTVCRKLRCHDDLLFG